MTDRPAILSAPEAWAVVPVEPEHGMTRRGSAAVSCLSHAGANAVYTAMLAARPDPNALQEVVAYVETQSRIIAVHERTIECAENQWKRWNERAEAAEARVAELEAVLSGLADGVTCPCGNTAEVPAAAAFKEGK